MKAIILARVSTEEQKEAGNSLPAQLTRMRDYCERNKFEIIKTYSFDESAHKIKRDEFDKILEDIGKSKEKIAICFDKVDRLSRNIFENLIYWCGLGQILLVIGSLGLPKFLSWSTELSSLTPATRQMF